MPSEDRIAQALKALSDAKEFFVSSVAKSAEEVRGILERERGVNENPQVKLAHELGPFAVRRKSGGFWSENGESTRTHR